MNKMLLLLIVVTGLAGCKKEEPVVNEGYGCYIQYNKIGATLAFVGFTLEEMDTVHVTKYAESTSLSTHLGADTFVYNTANYNRVELKNDTINLSYYAARQPALMEGYDYEVVVPATNSRYVITQMGYTPKEQTVRSSTPCKGSYVFSIAPDSGRVNGQMSYTGYYNVNYPPRYFSLRK